MRLAQREGEENDTLPEPEDLPFAPDEIDFIYEAWTLWGATGKKFLPWQLIPEIQPGPDGRRILTGILEMESLYSQVKNQLKKRNRKNDST